MRTVEPLLRYQRRAASEPNQWQAMRKVSLALLETAVQFDITNVTEWVSDMKMTVGDAWKMLLDLEDCVPPWEVTHFEWRDTTIHSAVVARWFPGRGLVATQWDCGPDNEAVPIGEWAIEFDGDRVAHWTDDDGSVQPRVKYAYPEYIEALRRRSEIRTDDGRSIAVDDAIDMINSSLICGCAIVVFACSLLHCRNVETIALDERASMNRQQIRAREREGRPFKEFHRLVVRPVGGGRKTREQVEGGDGRKKRVHLCRGHFVEYGPKYGKGLLFGRIEGRFFVPPHVRGDARTGEVEKEYVLGKPASRTR